MKIYIISKKEIFILTILLMIIIFSSYCILAVNNEKPYCYEETYFCITSLSDFQDDTTENVQSKIDSIYSSNEKVAYLTFDDGPTKVATTKVLDILKEEDVKATFFVIGYRVEEFPNIVKRVYDEGHFIANHTYSHKNNKLYKNKDSFLEEIQKTDLAISNTIGTTYCSHLFRFPNGSKSNNYLQQKKNCIKYLQEINYCYVDWNALNEDSIKKYSSDQLVSNLKKSCKNKDSLIILMHDTADVSRSYLALKDSIRFLKNEGYSFKTFQELVQ